MRLAESHSPAGLIRRILAAKRQNPGADTTALEQPIDRQVYRTRQRRLVGLGYALYLPSLKLRRASGLTPAEIKFTPNPVSGLVEENTSR